MSKKRSLDYKRAMNARSGKIQKVIENKTVYVEELVVNADTDDENGIGESIDEGEENIEDIELESDSD